jgi:hypothetical protein
MTPQQLQALRTELLLPAYDVDRGDGASGSLAERLNDRTTGLTRRRTVPIRDLYAYLDIAFLADGRSVWRALKDGKDEASQLGGACWSAVEMREHPVGYELDLDLPAVQGLLAVLLGGGVLTQAILDDVDALADVPCSRAEQLFGPDVVVSDRDVDAALALPGA